MRVDIDPDLPIATSIARQAVTDRLAQFGIPTGSGPRVIRVSFDPACPAGGPGTVVVAHTTPDRIWVCQAILDTLLKTPRGPYLAVSHEMGHMLGLVGHLPAGGNLMAAILDNYKDATGFSAADIRAICAAGHIASPACD